MTNEEKRILLAEDVFDVDAADVTPEKVLEESDFWDSMSKLSLVSIFNERFGKMLDKEQIKTFVTVQDILNAMA